MAAALSGLVPNSFAHKSCRVGGGGVGAASFGFSPLVRLHQGSIATSRRRCSLTTSQRHGGASFFSLRCRNGSDEAFLFPEFGRDMYSIVVISLSGPCIPAETHEKLAIVESEWPRSIDELCALDDIQQAAVLSIWGSRLDIYVLAVRGGNGVSQVTDWISKSRGVPASEIRKHSAVLYDRDAIQHLFEFSSGGLDSDDDSSLVLDETHALEQVEGAFCVGSGAAAGFGSVMMHLFMHATDVGARVGRETTKMTSIFAAAVAGAAVELAVMKLSESSSCASPLDNAKILVVGAGKMAALVIKHLVARGCKKMVIVDDDWLSVEFMLKDLTEEEEEEEDVVLEIIYKPESKMYECAAAADVVFTTILSEKPLFLKQHVEQRQQQQRQLLFIDMSVPRNVSPCVAIQGTAVVYNVDDLKRIVYEDAAVAANNEDRLMKARRIIDEETNRLETLRDLNTRGNANDYQRLLELYRKYDVPDFSTIL